MLNYQYFPINVTNLVILSIPGFPDAVATRGTAGALSRCSSSNTRVECELVWSWDYARWRLGQIKVVKANLCSNIWLYLCHILHPPCHSLLKIKWLGCFLSCRICFLKILHWSCIMIGGCQIRRCQISSPVQHSPVIYCIMASWWDSKRPYNEGKVRV